MRRFKTALIGCGAIHESHAAALADSPYAELCTVVDVIEPRAAATAAKYGCAYTTDYRMVLEDPSIEVVHLCTPHFLHAEMAVEALRAGKHVLTEKPLGLSLAQCEEMIRASDASGRQLGVCFQNRYNSNSLRVRELVSSGAVGRVLGAKAFLTWGREASYYTGSPWKGTWAGEGGGVLINQSIHTLDLLQWVLGMPAGIKGNVDRRFLQDVIEVEDTAEATLRYADGTLTFFFATNGYPTDAAVEIEVVCEKAVLRLAGDLTVRWSDGHVETYFERNRREGDKAYWGGSHRDLIQDFYECLTEDRPFPLDGRQGMQSLRLITALYASSEKRDWVTP
jgi:UDP-N-acetyl-2-amino-2-deoxyglucuronate dehydrogenase